MTQTMSSPIDRTALAALDRAHVIHPHRPAGAGDSLIVVRGEGCRIWDAAGNEYLDTAAGLALTQVGHGRAELAEAAATQMRELEYYPSFWEFANPRAIELAARLAALVGGKRSSSSSRTRRAPMLAHAGERSAPSAGSTASSANHGPRTSSSSASRPSAHRTCGWGSIAPAIELPRTTSPSSWRAGGLTGRVSSLRRSGGSLRARSEERRVGKECS